MTTNKVSTESSFYFQLIHVNNIWNIKTVFMQYGYRLQWYGIFPLFLIQYLAQLGLLILAAQRKWKFPRQFKRLRVYAHETVAKAFVNLNIELSSIHAIKTAV